MSFRRAILILAAALAGCGRPNQANVELRKQIQGLQHDLDQCRADRDRDVQAIRGLQARLPTEPTLPPDQLAKLFTTHGLRFGSLTGGYHIDPAQIADDGVKVYVYPVDQDSQRLKAAGSFVVEAFDLSAKGDPRLGRWAFPLEESRKLWAGFFVLEYNYLLTCPWQKMPGHADVTIRVTFIDELTKIPYWADHVVKVALPPSPTTATAPDSQPAK